MATNNAINANQTLSTTSAVVFNTVTAQAGYAQTAVSGVTTLSTAAYGTQVLATGSSAYAITLPAQSAGYYIDFQILTTSNALVTLTPASGTIQGQSTFILGSNESCRLYTNGTNWFVENLVLQPVYALATCSTATVIQNTPTKVPYNATVYDIGSFWDTSTNFRYTPKYPGKYAFTVTYNAGITTGNQMNAYLYKNGSAFLLAQTATSNSSINASVFVTGIVALNGSTDYVEGFGASTTTPTLTASTTSTFMSMQRIGNI